MTALDQQFQIAQSRLKRQPVKRTMSVAKCSVQLAGIDAPTNAERLAMYVAKRESARTAA